MLVEIPNLEVILGVIVAFLVGVSGVYLYYAISNHFKSKNGADSNSAYSDRFAYYEKQLIDMKIRLDSLSVLDAETRFEEPAVQNRTFVVGGKSRQEPHTLEIQNEPQSDAQLTKHSTPGTPKPTNKHLNSTDYVLHLITDRPMTSRDIQTMLKKSREHTSRLMRGLYIDGYVRRDTGSKPYTYSITEKGRTRIKM